MKKILVLFSALFIFLAIVPKVSASDLEVQCNDKCYVSSNEPLFAPDTNWIPEKSVIKNVVIKNYTGSSQDIYFKIDPKKTGDLDKYILLNFSNDSDDIWNGTLEKLTDIKRIPLKKINNGSKLELTINASMDQFAPNEAQGQSSVFDFAFGFDGQKNSELSNTNTNGESTNNEGSENSGNGSVVTDLSNVISSILKKKSFAQGTRLVEGSIDKSIKTKNNSSSVMGLSNKCSNSWYWILFLIAQASLTFLYLSKRVKFKISFFTNLLGFLLFTVFVYLKLCTFWPIMLSLMVFVISPIYLKGPFIIKRIRNNH